MIVNGGYHQKARLLANHGGGQGWVRAYNVALETPGDGERPVAPGDGTHELGGVALVHRVFSEGERSDCRRH